MNVDLLERHFIHKLEAHHHHTRDPEKQDIEAGYQTGCGIELIQSGGFVGPAHGREWPQGRGEPGVEDIRFLAQLATAAVAADRRILAGNGNQITVVTKPGRDSMSPPDLAADAPVADIVHPLEVGLFPLFRDDFGTPVLDGGDSLLGQRLDLDVPLQAHIGFDDGLATIALADRIEVLFGALEQFARRQIRQHLLPGGIAIQALIGAAVGVDHTRLVKDIDEFEVMATADFKVVEVVSRSDLYRAATEFLVNVIIGDDRDFTTDQRQHNALADQISIAFVFGMHGHGGIAEHSFGSGGGHHQQAVATFDRVAKVPELTLLIFMLHLKVGKSRVAARAPVDQAIIPVDQTLFVEGDEHLTHRLGQTLVHSEAFPLPVAGGTEAFELIDDLTTRFAPPLPDPLNEAIATQIMAVPSFGGQLLFHHILGSNTGMIRAGLPEDFRSAHAHPARQNIL